MEFKSKVYQVHPQDAEKIVIPPPLPEKEVTGFLSSEFPPGEDFTGRTAYKVYKPIAILGKYFGIVPLPGLYEWSTANDDGGRGTLRRVFLDRILPLTAFSLQIFAVFNIVKLLVYCANNGLQSGIDFLTIILVNFSIIAHSPMCTIILFSKSKRIVEYLKKHDELEVLLRRKQKDLQVVTYVLLVSVAFGLLLKTPCWISMLRLHLIEFDVDINEWYPDSKMAVGFFCIAMLVMTMAEGQPEVTYIMFQHILKTGFNLLNEEIRKHQEMQRNNYSIAKPAFEFSEAEKIKRFRQLHQRLCDLASEVDSMTSPTILLSFLENIIIAIVGIFKLVDQFNGQTPNVGISFALTSLTLIPFTIIAVISGSADATSSAASAVVPSLFSSMKLETPEAREEILLFATKVQNQRIRFSASGFFFINRSILTTVVASVATYVIIMMQFKTEKPE